MTSADEAAFDARLPADMVLGQADIGVLVADRLGHVLFLNEYAARLSTMPAGRYASDAASPQLVMPAPRGGRAG